MPSIIKYWHTLKYLRTKQIRYRLNYSFKNFFLSHHRSRLSNHPPILLPLLSNPTEHNRSYISDKSFIFLNLKHEFGNQIDWNFNGHGKLWTYNLNYFDFLLQAALEPETGVMLMMDFTNSYNNLKDGKEPYPTSLRIMNWIVFVSKHRIENRSINQVIFHDLRRLGNNLEYHLMGNHLLENAFALLFGSLYFQDHVTYQKSKELLTEQLEEQILNDGAHFELSPMYHQIILSRLLSCIDLLQHNDIFDATDLLERMIQKSRLMLGWLSEMSFENKSLPNVNDSTIGIAPSSKAIFERARSLGLDQQKVSLGASGYRKRKTSNYELLADVGDIGPDYIPGHAHSDTLGFVLHTNTKPIIIDTGISTYEKNDLRQLQRGTASHNTVMINNKEQSEVWGGFRVARRAKATILEDSPQRLVASHDGYSVYQIVHERTFEFSENTIQIEDVLTRPAQAIAHLHFHPEVRLSLINNELRVDTNSITFEGATSVKVVPYEFAAGFNLTCPAKKVAISFSQQLTTVIQIA